MTAFFERDGDRFVPSELTRGPWDPQAQHAGPPAALLGRAVARAGTRIGRIAIEILRPVPLEPLTVATRVERPGRNVELVAAELATAADGTAVAVATRLAPACRAEPTPVPPDAATRRPAPSPAPSGRSSRRARRSATTRRWRSASSPAASRNPGPRARGCACAAARRRARTDRAAHSRAGRGGLRQWHQRRHSTTAATCSSTRS